MLPLLLKRWRELMILILLLCLAWADKQNQILRAGLSEKKYEEKTKVVYGPSKVITKYIQVEGKPVIQEKIVWRQSVERDRELASINTPACPSFPKRFGGVMLSPRPGKTIEGILAGYTLYNLDLSVGWRWEGLKGPVAQASYRF